MIHSRKRDNVSLDEFVLDHEIWKRREFDDNKPWQILLSKVICAGETYVCWLKVVNVRDIKGLLHM